MIGMLEYAHMLVRVMATAVGPPVLEARYKQGLQWLVRHADLRRDDIHPLNIGKLAGSSYC